MRITIDNLDGRGAIDYSAAIAADGAVTIQRSLNVPSRCTAEMVLGVDALPAPARRGRVVVSSDSGTVLFTGYLPVEAVPTYAGMGTEGPVYRARISAVSDEWLLDKQGSGASTSTDGLLLGSDPSSVVQQLTPTTQASAGSVTSGLSVVSGGNARALGAFAVQPAAGWSTNAGAAANASYSAYRALSGTVSVTPVGSVTHALSDADGTLQIAALSVSHVRELANDVTLTGEEEPTAYVQEIFSGDGTTTAFPLSQAAFRGSNRTLLRDSFQGATFDSSQWVATDNANYLQLTSAGFTLNGGSGYDGQTTLQSANSVEIAGYLLAELGGVVFGAASDGMLAGFYSGPLTLATCMAGFRVRQSTSATGGVTVVMPVVGGTEVGTVFTPQTGHKYTLRVRLFCREMQRVPQRYYCMVDGQVQSFGASSAVNAPLNIAFDLVDEGASSNTPATVLYDSAAAGSAVTVSSAACTFAVANSVSLYGSIASVEVTRPGSMWVESTLPNGSIITRLMGSAGDGVDCKVSYGSDAGSKGSVTFFAGRVPVAGERITVSYRLQERSVARLADSSSMAAEAAAGVGVQVPGLSRWLGKVSAPIARSSADCEAAAQAVLAMAGARTAAIAGQYAMLNPTADIWPGDVLQITSAGASSSLLVRTVVIEDGHATPELLKYKFALANDWATQWEDGLGLKLSETIASDVVLPASAASAPAQVLPNLQALQVVMLNSSAVQIDTGVAPPSGGGFEVRRRDGAFGAGMNTPDLVLRSPVRNFSIPRSSQTEEFYIRMYDASETPLYSRFSSAVFLNWPVT